MGFITTTTPKTIAVIKEGLTNYINFDDFDLITSDECVNLQKPNPEAYKYALRKLEISASEAVAVEDTKSNQSAASLCGIDCYLFPGEFATIDYRDMAEEKFIPDMLELSKILDEYKNVESEYELLGKLKVETTQLNYKINESDSKILALSSMIESLEKDIVINNKNIESYYECKDIIEFNKKLQK